MKITKIQGQPVFARAFTTKEQKEFEQVQAKARKELGLDKTTLTIFDFCFPSGAKDSGIGTSFSSDAQKVVEALKANCGINSIQLQPQGQISNYVRSPYSGTNFSLGEHLIDLTKLKEKEYGSILSASDLEDSYLNRTKEKGYVDYDNVFAPDGQKTMLKKAYINFRELPANSKLKKEFTAFKKENSYWVEKDALFEAAAFANNSQDIKNWNDADKYLFKTKEGNAKRIAKLKTLEEKGTKINIVEFNEFVQFIADKQQKESKAAFNSKGIDIYGDCQIGFSQKDFWAHRSAFYETNEFGCELENKDYSCWSPAIDFSKLDGEAGELLAHKFDLAFKRYDGVRIDAAWQLICPLICAPKPGGQFDKKGNKLGDLIPNQPLVGKKIIDNFIIPAARKHNVPNHKIMLELLGGNSYQALDYIKDNGMTLIHITQYGKDDWGNVKYYESKGPNKYQNLKPGDYTIGPGTHDNITVIEQAKNADIRIGYLSRNLDIPSEILEESQEEIANAIFAETYTTKNQFATINDVVGSARTLNVPNTTAGNWQFRLPPNWEERYHQNLTYGKGLNYPEALATALNAKKGDSQRGLVEKLRHFAQILRQNGPMTREEADKHIK